MSERVEKKMIMELQSKLGWMFHEHPGKDRWTMHFRRNRKTGKSTLSPARKIMITVPGDSWLAKQMEASAKAKAPKAKHRRTRQ